MIEWRERTRPEMGFLTEASITLADDAELRELMVAAGFRKVFVGIETPSVASSWRSSVIISAAWPRRFEPEQPSLESLHGLAVAS